MANDTPDVWVRNEGTVVQFLPLSDAAREWIDQNVQSEDWQWMGRSLVVDHRYAGNLIEGMQGAGLVVTI